MSEEQLRAAAVWAIAFEKFWTQYEHANLLVHPPYSTPDEVERARLEMARAARQHADDMCRYVILSGAGTD